MTNPRGEITDREALKEELLGFKPADETFSGTPVSASEMPADTFEEGRAATPGDAAEAEAVDPASGEVTGEETPNKAAAKETPKKTAAKKAK